MATEVCVGLIRADKSAALPLKEVAVKAEVKGYLLGLQANLKYQNDSSDPVEVLFRLPLESSQAVVGLTAVLDGRTVKAQLRDKREARDTYEDAVASGKTVALGEESSGDVFSISLGNLRGGGEAEIQLKLVGELTIDAEGSVRFSLPATLKPRYTPAGSTDPLAPVQDESGQVEHGTVKGVHHFELRVLNVEQISSVTSPTHSIEVACEEAQVKVTLRESETLQNDLVVLINHKDPHKPRTLVEPGAPHEEGKGAGFLNHLAVMVNFFPEIPFLNSPSEFIFLVDRSGSMSGSFIRSASEALVLFLKSLPVDCHFNIYGFGSRYESLFPTSVPYTQQNLDQATQHAQQLKADLGGTELLPPLQHIFKQPTKKGLDRQIFVLTDGAVSNTGSCITEVRKNSDKARYFTFGIGSGASTALVSGLARAGHGTAEFVKGQERLQPKVVRSLKHALQPAAKNISVNFTVPSGFTVLKAPTLPPPPIFSGEKLVLYAIIQPQDSDATSLDGLSGEVELKATIQEAEICFKIPFEADSTSLQFEIPAVHHLAAKAFLVEMEQDGIARDDIVKFSMESGVVSSNTAFIAVDEHSLEPVSGPMKSFDVTLGYQEEEQCATLRLAGMDCYEGSAVFAKQRSYVKRRKGGGVVGAVGSALGSAVGSVGSALGSAASTISGWFSKRSVTSIAAVRSEAMEEEVEKKEEEEGDAKAKHASLLSQEERSSSVVDEVVTPKPKTLAANYPAFPKPSLSSLVALQQANGSWSLTGDLTTQLGKEQQVVEDSCPSGCPSSVWATALALGLLKVTYSSQQDEWELVAKKAESWLKNQSLPPNLSLLEILSTAQAFLQ